MHISHTLTHTHSLALYLPPSLPPSHLPPSRYVTVDDVVGKFGARAALTENERTKRTALFVSIQKTAETSGTNTYTKQVEGLHILSLAVSINVANLACKAGQYSVLAKYVHTEREK